MTVRANEGPRLSEPPANATDYEKQLYQDLHRELSDLTWRSRALEQTVGIAPRKPNALSIPPVSADYLVKTANSTLTAERVVTDTATVTWDWSTAGQAKATASGSPAYLKAGGLHYNYRTFGTFCLG